MVIFTGTHSVRYLGRQKWKMRRRGRPRKVKGKTEGQQMEAEMLQGLEARAAQMDEDTSLAW